MKHYSFSNQQADGSWKSDCSCGEEFTAPTFQESAEAARQHKAEAAEAETVENMTLRMLREARKSLIEKAIYHYECDDEHIFVRTKYDDVDGSCAESPFYVQIDADALMSYSEAVELAANILDAAQQIFWADHDYDMRVHELMKHEEAA